MPRAGEGEATQKLPSAEELQPSGKPGRLSTSTSVLPACGARARAHHKDGVCTWGFTDGRGQVRVRYSASTAEQSRQDVKKEGLPAWHQWRAKVMVARGISGKAHGAPPAKT